MALTFHNPTPFWRDTVHGSVEGDEIFTYWDNDTIHGYEGDDLINGGQGDDVVYGGDGNDSIFGEIGNDRLYGDDGNDIINGGAGNDQIYGGIGNDIITGGQGSDRMFGGANNDTFLQASTTEADLIDGGSGTDTVNYRPAPGYYSPSINARLADGTADGRAIVTNTVFSSSGPVGTRSHTDTLRSIENLTTGGGNDSLTGNAGANRFDAGSGNDVLRGGGGADTLIGGFGNDTFVYTAVTDSPVTTLLGGLATLYGGTDLIVGFGDGAGNQDIIDLRAIDANTTLAGDQSFFLENNDGRTSTGELRHFTITDGAQNGRNVSVLAADTNGDGNFDFGLRFDRVVTSFSTDDFLF